MDKQKKMNINNIIVVQQTACFCYSLDCLYYSRSICTSAYYQLSIREAVADLKKIDPYTCLKRNRIHSLLHPDRWNNANNGTLLEHVSC